MLMLMTTQTLKSQSKRYFSGFLLVRAQMGSKEELTSSLMGRMSILERAKAVLKAMPKHLPFHAYLELFLIASDF